VVVIAQFFFLFFFCLDGLAGDAYDDEMGYIALERRSLGR
jgi:hypothetical protein